MLRIKPQANRPEQHDQGRDALLAIDDIQYLELVRSKVLGSAPEADDGSHEMAFVLSLCMGLGQIVKEIFALPRCPAVRPLIVRNAEQAPIQQLGK